MARPACERGTLFDRFWAKVNKAGGYPDFDDPLVCVTEADGECWLWMGAPRGGRYGYIRSSIRGEGGYPEFAVHRLSFEMHGGELDASLVIDHLCRVKLCVNPAHLEAVTNGENVMRGASFAPRNAAKTTCPQGHSFAEYGRKTSRGRYCSVCRAEYDKRKYAKARGIK